MNSKKNYTIVALLVVVVCLLILGLNYTRQNSFIPKSGGTMPVTPSTTSSQTIAAQDFHIYEHAVEPVSYFDTSTWKVYADKYISFRYPAKYALATSTDVASGDSAELRISIYDPTLKPGETVQGDSVENGLIDIVYLKDVYNGDLYEWLDPSEVNLVNKQKIQIGGVDAFVVKGWENNNSQNFRASFFNKKLFLFTSDSIDMGAEGNYLRKSEYEKVFDTVLTTINYAELSN
jgi:hypothetical protein